MLQSNGQTNGVHHDDQYKNCFTQEQYTALASKKRKPTKQEKRHIADCEWCRYLAKKGDKYCLTGKQLISISFGRRLRAEEREHTAECPACRWIAKEVRKP